MKVPVVMVAAGGLIDPEGRVLINRRPDDKIMPGLWEFPGGKIVPGETPEEALIRELHEELAIEVTKEALMPLTFSSYLYPRFHLTLLLYTSRLWSGTPQPAEGQEMAWVNPDKMNTAAYVMPPANIPLISCLRRGV